MGNYSENKVSPHQFSHQKSCVDRPGMEPDPSYPHIFSFLRQVNMSLLIFFRWAGIVKLRYERKLTHRAQ